MERKKKSVSHPINNAHTDLLHWLVAEGTLFLGADFVEMPSGRGSSSYRHSLWCSNKWIWLQTVSAIGTVCVCANPHIT